MNKKLENAALLLMAALLVLLAWQDWAGAQEEKPIPVLMVQKEREFLLNMCEAARWANRIIFDGVCDKWKVKLEMAEKDVIKVEPKQPTPCAPNECPTKPLTKD